MGMTFIVVCTTRNPGLNIMGLVYATFHEVVLVYFHHAQSFLNVEI